jgi:6-phosphogluconolactonase
MPDKNAVSVECDLPAKRQERSKGTVMKVKHTTGLFVAAFMIALTANAAFAATFVYVANAETSDVNVFKLDPKSGDLSAVQTIAVPGLNKGGGSTPLAISPNKKLLYMGLRGDPLVAATFSIDRKTGKLTHVGNGPLADSMAAIATDRSGKFLLSASYGGHKISVNPIGKDGVPAANTQVVTTPPNAHMILPDTSNRYVFSTSLGGDVVNQFKFDATKGALAPNDPATVAVKAKSGPRHFVFHPKGKAFYLLGELDGSLSVFDYNKAKGTLKERTGSAMSVTPPGFTGKIWAADLRITPNGMFLYGSERTSSTLTGFKVDRTGKLTRIGDWPTEKQPRGFGVDPAGRYLVSVGQLSHSLTTYAINPKTGALKQLKQYPTGKNPNWVEIVNIR